MIPITLICGYLGSGKTTLINQLLNITKKPIGVLVNDFGDLNIDSKLISNEDDLTISLTNGCICCSLNDDLGESMNLMLSKNIDALVLEASGVALPIKMSNYGTSWPGYDLGKVITVVEGQTLKELLSDKFVSKTINSQINQSDLIYLNRYSLQDKNLLTSMDSDFLVESEINELASFIFDIQKSDGNKPVSSFEHNLFSKTLSFNNPVNKEDIIRFLQSNPNIERLKGWIYDSEKRSWLVQITRSERNFTPSKYETKSRLVAIYKDSLNLESLRI